MPAARVVAPRSGFPPDLVEDIRRAVSIVQVVEQHVSLKRAGRTLKGLCPFHSEKTPSFHVDEGKGFYHCFGCGAGGDAFRFVMQVEGLSFPEAVRSLGGRAGIAVPDERLDAAGVAREREADALRAQVFAINAAAQEVFASELAEGRGLAAREAASYLARRGIGPETVASFGLGFAPDSWDFLLKRLSRFPQDLVVTSGLAVPSEKGRGAYDRFRGRVTFPIRSVSDRVVAFGGRITGDGEPKYLNSPESPVYVKGRHLFGLDRARTAIRREGRAILVEGYLDCISLHAHGIDHAVAVLGTALTHEQAQLLARFTQRVVVAFDGDAAGQAATRRSLEVLLAEGLDVRVATLPEGVDPDDLVRSRGREGALRVLDAADSFFDFLLRCAARDHDLGSPPGRVSALNELLPFIAGVKDRLLRSQLADAACQGLQIPPGLVREEVRRAVRQGRDRVEPTQLAAAGGTLSPAESALLAWALSDKEARAELRKALEPGALERLPHPGLFEAVLGTPEEEFSTARVLDALQEDWERQELSRLAVGSHGEPVAAERLAERVRSFLEAMGLSSVRAARDRKAEVDRQIAEAIRAGDMDAARRLMAEASALGRAAQA